MTDNELRALVASIAEAQKKTDAQLARTDAQLARTDAKLDQTAAQLARTDAKLDQTAAQLARTDAKLAETCVRVDAVCARLDRVSDKLDRVSDRLDRVSDKVDRASDRLDRVSDKLDRVSNKVDRMAEMYGGVSNNQGAVAEEFYYNSLKAKPVIKGIRFDYVDRNWGKTSRNQQDEFDLVLLNGSTVFVFEVKYKARESDLQRLLTTKKTNFNQFFPEYRDYDQHWGLATFHIHDKLKAQALKKGLTLLQRKGDIVETYAA